MVIDGLRSTLERAVEEVSFFSPQLIGHIYRETHTTSKAEEKAGTKGKQSRKNSSVIKSPSSSSSDIGNNLMLIFEFCRS